MVNLAGHGPAQKILGPREIRRHGPVPSPAGYVAAKKRCQCCLDVSDFVHFFFGKSSLTLQQVVSFYNLFRADGAILPPDQSPTTIDLTVQLFYRKKRKLTCSAPATLLINRPWSGQHYV